MCVNSPDKSSGRENIIQEYLIHDIFFINKSKLSFNTQSSSIRAKLFCFRINGIRKKTKNPSLNDVINNSRIYMGVKAKWLLSKKAFNIYFWSAIFFLIIIERKTGSCLHVQLPEICGTDISRSRTVVMDNDNIDRHLIKIK